MCYTCMSHRRSKSSATSSTIQITVTLNKRTSILAWKTKIGNSLLAEAHLPPDSDVFLRLTLLHLLVVVSLLLDQWTEDVLVLVGILIPKSGCGCGSGWGKWEGKEVKERIEQGKWV